MLKFSYIFTIYSNFENFPKMCKKYNETIFQIYYFCSSLLSQLSNVSHAIRVQNILSPLPTKSWMNEEFRMKFSHGILVVIGVQVGGEEHNHAKLSFCENWLSVS